MGNKKNYSSRYDPLKVKLWWREGTHLTEKSVLCLLASRMCGWNASALRRGGGFFRTCLIWMLTLASEKASYLRWLHLKYCISKYIYIIDSKLLKSMWIFFCYGADYSNIEWVNVFLLHVNWDLLCILHSP